MQISRFSRLVEARRTRPATNNNDEVVDQFLRLYLVALSNLADACRLIVKCDLPFGVCISSRLGIRWSARRVLESSQNGAIESNWMPSVCVPTHLVCLICRSHLVIISLLFSFITGPAILDLSTSRRILINSQWTCNLWLVIVLVESPIAR